jgi:uncharacterized protein YmfQ (DUF2313 family)
MSLDFVEIYKHLLPRAKAWKLNPVNKRLRQFFEGLSFEALKIYADLIWLDIFPSTTRDIEGWEDNFGLGDYDLNEQQRRDRLDARWKEEGGQDPRYIEDTLRAAGFDVYVHEWWKPGTEPTVGVDGCAEPRNPTELLQSDLIIDIECGMDLAECGEESAECGGVLSPVGYLLVNNPSLFSTAPIIACADTEAECGAVDAECGFTVVTVPADNNLTFDSSKWPYFLYIGGETFPELATVSIDRRKEFETKCLSICPLEQWLGMMVQYN